MKRYVSTHLKDMNRKTVYELLSSVGEISRAEISRRTGISSPTVLKIIDFFLENNFVIEMGEGSSAVGRKPQILKFNSEALWSIGVEFEGDFLKIGIVDLSGNIKLFKNIRVNPVFDEIISKRLPVIIDGIIEESKIPREKILGIGLGIPCVTDPSTYMIEIAPLVGIYDRMNCKEMIDGLSKKVGLPVLIDNDVNAAAWGEFICRKMDNKTDLLYVSLGTGLGSGLILDGKIRRGVSSAAGQMGYMVFDKNYKASKAEPGWLESLINFGNLTKGWGFFPSIIQNNEADIANLALDEKELDQLVDYIAGNLALGIANIVTVVGISFVVLGGVTVKALGDRLVQKVDEYISRLCLVRAECHMQKSLEPGVVGAASIVASERLKHMLEG